MNGKTEAEKNLELATEALGRVSTRLAALSQEVLAALMALQGKPKANPDEPEKDTP